MLIDLKKLELLILKQYSNRCNNPNLVFSILWVSLPIFPFFNYQKIGRLAENWWKLRSTSSLREEEEFLLSGKARLRVKSLVSLIMMLRQHMYTSTKGGRGTENVHQRQQLTPNHQATNTTNYQHATITIRPLREGNVHFGQHQEWGGAPQLETWWANFPKVSDWSRLRMAFWIYIQIFFSNTA